MAFEQRAAVAEDVENLVGGHALAFSCRPSQSAMATDSASATVARRTWDRPGVSFKVDSTSVSCARSLTSSSKMFLWKSGEIDPHHEIMDVGLRGGNGAGNLRQRAGLVLDQHGDDDLVVALFVPGDVPAHVDPGDIGIVEPDQRVGMGGIDHDRCSPAA